MGSAALTPPGCARARPGWGGGEGAGGCGFHGDGDDVAAPWEAGDLRGDGGRVGKHLCIFSEPPEGPRPHPGSARSRFGEIFGVAPHQNPPDPQDTGLNWCPLVSSLRAH